MKNISEFITEKRQLDARKKTIFRKRVTEYLENMDKRDHDLLETDYLTCKETGETTDCSTGPDGWKYIAGFEYDNSREVDDYATYDVANLIINYWESKYKK